jgi:hypothetical protein
MRLRASVLGLSAIAVLPLSAGAVTIDFDDVVGSQQDVTNRYVADGIIFGAIANPFPLAGPFPAPATLPAVLGGVQTWTEGFPSATSPLQVAVAMSVPGATDPGDAGILMSFAFDIGFLSLVGNDVGGCPGADCESVTLTAYDAAGQFIGQTFTSAKLPGFDRTLASIALPGMRHVAFNYTDTQFGFYSIDDVTFERAGPGPVPEPTSVALLGLGLAGLGLGLRRRLA